jgi:hypothetical protein
MEPRLARCGDAECDASIIWTVTTRGRRMPVDAEPSADGNVMIVLDTDQDEDTPMAFVVDPTAPPLTGWRGTLHHSHFETCRSAERFRRRKTT